MEFWIEFSRDELNTVGNILNKQYAINVNTLHKYSSYAIDNFDAIAEETAQLVRLINKIESFGHSFPKK